MQIHDFVQFFGIEDVKKEFAINVEECQALVAMIIIAKQSYWLGKDNNVALSVVDAFEQFKKQGHVEKLKRLITSETLPSKHGELLKFLYSHAFQM
ncbi:hypothetical protein AX15_004296 [Amanita polypyramis BW_CC]|nr:hypothetical protein AX15_004296 [Amanita polypyramis BW_CC]